MTTAVGFAVRALRVHDGGVEVQGNSGSMSTFMSQASCDAAAPLRFGQILGVGSLQWLLKRNCSLPPRQLIAIYLSLCLLTFTIAALCWNVGATLVLPFACAEVLVFGGALLVYARHATDCEHIRLHRGSLTVQHTSGARIEQIEFEPSWVRVEPQRGDRSLIELSGQGRRIAVGRYVQPELRREFADELRWALRRWPCGQQLDAV